MELRPLTDRIVTRLPGERGLWIVAWALVPWANAGANLLLGNERRSAVWEQNAVLVVVNYAALSVGVVVAIWGSQRIARSVTRLRVNADVGFDAMNSVAAPVVAAAVTAVAFGAAAYARDGWDAAIVRGGTWFVLGIALWTFLWVYVVLQLGLDRLGREHLLSDAAPVEPGLGLRPLGDLAFMALWMLLIWLVPVVLTGLPDVVGVVIGLLVLALGLAAFFFSLHRLHRQMLEVKEGELRIARDLYRQAYDPVRAEPSLDSLERQRALLGAADALEKRAHTIHEWPVDEGTFARVLTITTSVIAMTVARLILDPLGL